MDSFDIGILGNVKRVRQLKKTYRANAEPEVITYDRHEESDEEEYDEEENVDDADAKDSEEFPWPVRNVPAKGIFYSKRKPESGAQGLTPEGTRNRTASGGHSANDNDGENRKDADVLGDTVGGKKPNKPHNKREQEEKNDEEISGLEAVKEEQEQEANLKAFEKATELVLDRVVFNVTMLLGICLATGFATWA
ncbi:hypothetical protein ACEPPN_014085 [Leptodophora sp. 'Broadleaf-Isolate-01']